MCKDRAVFVARKEPDQRKVSEFLFSDLLVKRSVSKHMDNAEVSPRQRRKWFFLRLTTLFVIGGALVLAAAAGFFSPAGVTKAHAATWTQVWSDEFNGAAGTGVNTSNWKYDTGTGFGTGEIETMSSSTNNVYQDGQGHLVIKAIRDSGGNWTSGRIETQLSNFAAPAGGEVAMEASIQQPNLSGSAALGYWPAFWMLGSGLRSGGSWPGVGEVDILEDVNGLSDVYGTLHCGTDPGGPCNEPNGIGSGARACSGCQTGFHTYRVELDRSVSPEQIRWYLDGNNYFTINSNQVDATTWANAVDHAFFIIFDLAMGGGFPNGVSGQTTPTSSTASGGSLLVDYVRVYTSGGGTGGTTPTPTPSSSWNYIKNLHSGLVLDDTNGGTANGTLVQQWAEGAGNANQEWTLISAGNGYYYIKNLHSGLVLDDTNGGTANGTQVQLWALFNGDANQEWRLVSAGNGYDYIINLHSGLALDDTNGSTSNGTIMQLWAQGNGNANQEWTFQAA